MPTAQKYIETAASYIGTKGDKNIFNKWYWVDQTKTYKSDPGTAWCACFQSYVAMKCGLKCSYSASAAGFATQFERIPVDQEGTVRPGDIVVFNWDGRTSTSWCDHVGVVEWSTIASNGKFGTIEGNTGNSEVKRVTRDNWSTYFTAFYRPKYDSQASGSTPSSQSKSSKVLYGIDVSSNQPKTIAKDVRNDFCIVKMSGNPTGYSWNYVNPYAEQQADDAYAKHGLVGFYHFTYGRTDANEEADFFVEQVCKIGYLNKAMLVIDYEAHATNLGRSWIKKFADRVKAKAGYSPVIYASGSVIVNQGLASLGYPLWCANYSKGYQQVDGYSTSGMKIYPGCESSVLWQFTSSGRLSGYSGNLDLDTFYGTAEDWKKLAGQTVSDIPKAQPSAASGKLDVDGEWGVLTQKELQRQLGVSQTGAKDKATYKALQKRLKVKQDGIFGPITKKALQKKLGVKQDGSIGPVTVKALQKVLNAKKVAKW